MKCFYHNDIDATAQCTNCGRYICSQCCMQEYSTLKILCPDCTKALNEQAEYQAKDDLKKNKKSLKKRLIIYILVLFLGFIFTNLGFASVCNYPGSAGLNYFLHYSSFIEKVIALTIGGIPGAIATAIMGMPTTTEEKILNELNKLRFDNGCLAIFIQVVFSCILGYLFYIFAIVCVIFSIYLLAKLKKSGVE
ncbi:hypothetical protein SAMN02910447_00345 [Ruminococcus sp. YE71]|uniref:hypothetical protein n=1 Tax=unclassified Ruminococcus TaxID=2608920 RepID=UPI000885D5C3|nr:MULTISPECIES: hypothetical protein [unclassified Ruminococcus]SDA09217.1 hypothetical protein SAMN02910446_00004 [Ruminococcus sp. YE78]SFW13009.1 hypothetical protein SAMN02910447_00345 [Ruminococcus sp. YE71]